MPSVPPPTHDLRPMASRARLWQRRRVTSAFDHRHYWIFCLAAIAVWLALGWPVLQNLATGVPMRGAAVSPLWLLAFLLFGAGVVGAMLLRSRPRLRWGLLVLQVAAVAAMAVLVPWAMMSVFLIITAWQVAMETGPGQALGWIAVQTLVAIGGLAQALNPDMCWILGLSVALQLFFAYTAQTARALARTNGELRAAQAIIADTVRDAERLRIARELHDAWGHELTALGLQLEIASHVGEPERVGDHVLKARGLASALLAKVRDVVGTLRDAERRDLKDSLEALAQRVPRPRVHVDVGPGVQVGPAHAHALVRCAQEAVTNAVKHADAANVWLKVTAEPEGVRLVARNDGVARKKPASTGSGLIGMRERVETLGGRLKVRPGPESGFTVDAWLPLGTAEPA